MFRRLMILKNNLEKMSLINSIAPLQVRNFRSQKKIKLYFDLIDLSLKFTIRYGIYQNHSNPYDYFSLPNVIIIKYGEGGPLSHLADFPENQMYFAGKISACGGRKCAFCG